MEKYKIYIAVLILMVSWSISAQQIPLSTIFVENPFAFNPAVAGTDKGFKARINSRMQWLGFGDGPFTNTLSGYGPHAVRNIGYGVNLLIDRTGPVSMLKANGGFASNFFITSDIRASLGLNLGIIQYRADGSQFILPQNGTVDPSAPEIAMSNLKPDAGAGLFVYHHDWFLGLSAQQLFSNVIKFTDDGPNDGTNRLKTHFYGYAGYRVYVMNQKLVVEPSLLARMVASVPLQLDFCARVIYDQMFWGGINMRNSFESFNDLSLIFGYVHERRLCVSIAYDIALAFRAAKIRKVTAGTVELVIGYNFDEIRKGR